MINLNSNVSFKQTMPQLALKSQDNQTGEEFKLTQENLQKTAGLSVGEAEKLQKIVREANLPEKETNELQRLIAVASISQVAASNGIKLDSAVDNIQKKDRQSSGFKQTISNIAKFFTNLGQMTKATIKGLFYGAITGMVSVGAFYTFETLPKAIKGTGSLKHISGKGKVISTILALGVLAYHVIKGKLNANQKTADIDHKLKTDHRDGKF